MNLETRYLESLARLKEIAVSAPYNDRGNAEYLKAYTECKAAYLKIWRREQLPRWYNCAILRTLCVKEYRRWEAEQQQRVQRDQRRYVEALDKFLQISHLRSWN